MFFPLKCYFVNINIHFLLNREKEREQILHYLWMHSSLCVIYMSSQFWLATARSCESLTLISIERSSCCSRSVPANHKSKRFSVYICVCGVSFDLIWPNKANCLQLLIAHVVIVLQKGMHSNSLFALNFFLSNALLCRHCKHTHTQMNTFVISFKVEYGSYFKIWLFQLKGKPNGERGISVI